MIKLENVYKSYGRELFEDFSLTIKDGEFLGIKGTSGSGKTTLLNMIGGIEKIDAGDISLGKMSYSRLNAKIQKKLFRYHISFIFQNFGLLENETVYENLSLVLKLNKIPKGFHKENIIKALKRVNLDYVGLKAKPNTLSGGEQQRLAVARVILSDNPVILADEPTGSLDEANGDLVMQLLKSLNEKGKTVITVTHSNRYDRLFSRTIYLAGKE
ncbi:MAG: ABC transporter ATP-binding protein [Streptococcaceae bacterium]|jgi:putative ABC transport system ATP-binding protein|nr:ABC transporter ATP-binding protein [Streptococcaceae bacterium]